MTRATAEREQAPYRASAKLPGEGSRVAASDLLAFGERLIREASDDALDVTGVSLHSLGPMRSKKVVGEAVLLSREGPQIWRVTVSDSTGHAIADMTLTASAPVEVDDPQSAEIVPIAPGAALDPDGRRAQIARAARDVFAEKGFAAATMREVAAAAQMHVPTMYQYFRSKEEILELVYDTTISQAVEGMMPVLGADGAPEEKLEPIVRTLHAVNLQLRRGTLVMNRETRTLSPQARERVLGQYAAMLRRLGTVIAEGQSNGTFRAMDPNLAAVFVDALADLWVLRPFAVGHLDIDDYADELVAFVRCALAHDPTQRPDQPGV